MVDRNLNRRDFMKSIGVGAAAMPTMLHAADQKPMNIILIMADDVSQDLYGCYGNTEVKTPHIDRMAREGVMFKTAWATPMCS
ncbi:MAG: sulfatase-like hydrolase/transferase, partial [Candidatus Latescibacteria bacterium]|nr:sulfatase-like hydrolase/transferase [Candidatus Latescibacterota bacterium]